MSTILVPVDGSESSHRAAKMAAQMAPGLKANIRLLAVLDLSQLDVYDGFYLTEDQLTQLHEKLRQEVLDDVKNSLDLADGTAVEEELVRGHAKKVILDQASKDDVVMVCMGKTGKGALERLLQGSVSREVVQHAGVPCCVVP